MAILSYRFPQISMGFFKLGFQEPPKNGSNVILVVTNDSASIQGMTSVTTKKKTPHGEKSSPKTPEVFLIEFRFKFALRIIGPSYGGVWNRK